MPPGGTDGLSAGAPRPQVEQSSGYQLPLPASPPAFHRNFHPTVEVELVLRDFKAFERLTACMYMTISSVLKS